MWATVCLIAALVSALFAAFIWPSPPPSRPHIGWLAFALFLAYLLISGHK
jgi:hypothetical protein